MSFASSSPSLPEKTHHHKTHANFSIPISSFKATPPLFATKQNLLYLPHNNKENVHTVFIPTTTAAKTTKPEMSNVSRRRPIPTTRIHIMALDGIVNVNSLFSFGLFVGLAWYPTTDPAAMLIDSDTACSAGSGTAEGLIAFHVYSFSSFLFSSLVALALKQAIKISKDVEDPNGGWSSHLGDVNRAALRVGTLVSAFGSVFGCGFLMLALVDLVQIKLGRLSCGNFYTLAAIGPLVTLVPLALVIYVFLVLHAFTV